MPPRAALSSTSHPGNPAAAALSSLLQAVGYYGAAKANVESMPYVVNFVEVVSRMLRRATEDGRLAAALAAGPGKMLEGEGLEGPRRQRERRRQEQQQQQGGEESEEI